MEETWELATVSEAPITADEELIAKKKLLNTAFALEGERRKRDVDEAKYFLGLSIAASIFILKDLAGYSANGCFKKIAHFSSNGSLWLCLIFGFWAYRSFYAAELATFDCRYTALMAGIKSNKHDLDYPMKINKGEKVWGSRLKNFSMFFFGFRHLLVELLIMTAVIINSLRPSCRNCVYSDKEHSLHGHCGCCRLAR